jgi:hypothetical protein
MASESYSTGTTPFWTDPRRVIQQKILKALAAAGGGTGGAGVVGVGSPEGVVTAPVGTAYFNSSTDSFWYKKTGAGSSGWVQIIA